MTGAGDQLERAHADGASGLGDRAAQRAVELRRLPATDRLDAEREPRGARLARCGGEQRRLQRFERRQVRGAELERQLRPPGHDVEGARLDRDVADGGHAVGKVADHRLLDGDHQARRAERRVLAGAHRRRAGMAALAVEAEPE